MRLLAFCVSTARAACPYSGHGKGSSVKSCSCVPAQVTIACNGLIETIGRVLEGEVSHPMSAHPKTDPDTGKLAHAWAPKAATQSTA